MPAPKGSTISQEIGVVPVTIGNPPSFTLTAAQLGISSANFNPSFNQPPVSMNASKLGITTGNIPALTPDPPPVSINQIFGDSSQYKFLTFENGQMRLKITNNFPFAIQFGSNQIELRNFSNDSLVATFVFSGQIPSNSADSSQSVPLANVRMGAVLRIKTSMQVVGWAGKTITQTQDVVFLSSITNATIKSIFPDPAPPVPISQVFGDSAKYKHVIFETGQMSLSITNNFPFTIQFDKDTLELVNFNDTTQVVAKFGFSGPINTGLTSTSGTIQLANKQMDAILKNERSCEDQQLLRENDNGIR
jgi:hypothetical protein